MKTALLKTFLAVILLQTSLFADEVDEERLMTIAPGNSAGSTFSVLVTPVDPNKANASPAAQRLAIERIPFVGSAPDGDVPLSSVFLEVLYPVVGSKKLKKIIYKPEDSKAILGKEPQLYIFAPENPTQSLILVDSLERVEFDSMDFIHLAATLHIENKSKRSMIVYFPAMLVPVNASKNAPENTTALGFVFE